MKTIAEVSVTPRPKQVLLPSSLRELTVMALLVGSKSTIFDLKQNQQLDDAWIHLSRGLLYSHQNAYQCRHWPSFLVILPFKAKLVEHVEELLGHKISPLAADLILSRRSPLLCVLGTFSLTDIKNKS